MKKYFMFAAVFATGMLASCSSDSLIAGSDPTIEPTPTQEELVPIEIGVATTQTKASTRGTGTTGGTVVYDAENPTDPEANIWRGERINVMMYESGSFNPTKGGADGVTELYPNTSMVTPLAGEHKASGIAKEPTDPDEIGWNTPTQYTYTVKYYPSTGKSDFWGYYLGGYGAAAPAGAGTLKMYKEATLENETDEETDAVCVATDFVIDGTHDLLVGKATSDNPNAYSAKAARAGVQPDIAFKHLLSRLQFKVKPGLETGKGIQVTAIKVRSLTTGDMIVAYKNDEPEDRIVWDADQLELAYNAPTLPQLALKKRDGSGDMVALTPVELDWNAGTPAVYTAVAAGSDLTEGKTYYMDNTGGGAFVSNGSQTDVPADTYFELTSPAVPTGAVTTPVGEALIVDPQEKYEIEVDYQMNAHTARYWYQGSADFNEGDYTDDTELYTDKLITDLVRTTTDEDPEDPQPLAFAEGESYMVTITLYGPEEIKITTTLNKWNSSDNIEIGQD